MKLYSYNYTNDQYILEEKTLEEKIKNVIEDIDYGYSFKIIVYKNDKEAGIDFQNNVMAENMSDVDIEKTVSDIVKYFKYILSISQKCEIETQFNTPDPSWGIFEVQFIKSDINNITNEEYEEYRSEGFDILITDFDYTDFN